MVKNINDYIVNFKDIPYERISKERVLTGCKDLDYFIKGIEPGLTELIGATNVGKSIFTSMLINNAINQKYKVGVFASEHSLRDYKMIVMQQNAQKGEFDIVPFVDNNNNDTNIADWYVNKKAETRIAQQYDDNLFLFDTRKVERDVETICQWMVACFKEHNTRFFILDNFMEIDNNNQNQFQEQTTIITQIRNTALRYKFFVVLVMHTNKASMEDGFRLNIKSAFGTSNATNKGYNVLALYRKDYIIVGKGQEKQLDRFKADLGKAGFDYDKCDEFVEVLKTKGNGNGIVGLKYVPENKTFVQADKVSQTEADKIYKRYSQQVSIEERVENGEMEIYDGDEILF